MSTPAASSGDDPRSEDPPRVFISYGHEDATPFAERLHDCLRERGFDPFLDVKQGIPPGSLWDVRIEVGITDSRLLLFVLSKRSVEPGSFCRKELHFATDHRVPVVPVRLQPVHPPILIVDHQWVDALPPDSDAFDRLVEAVQVVASTGQPPLRDRPPQSWWYDEEPLDFVLEHRRYGGNLVGREWLFSQLASELQDERYRLILIHGGPGTGKTEIAARAAAVELNVKGVHFCSSAKAHQPTYWLRGLIWQLAQQFGPYREHLEGLEPPDWAKDPETLFQELVGEPLARCADCIEVDEPWVLVIDGLDEAQAAAGPGLMEALREALATGPSWLRFVVTSRPDQAILRQLDLPGVRMLPLSPDDPNNQGDLRRYITQRIDGEFAGRTDPAGRDAIIGLLLDRADGNFQWAVAALTALASQTGCRIVQADVVQLPRGLPGLYLSAFEKRFPDVEEYEGQLRPLLECLVAAQAPLPESLLLGASGLPEYEALSARQRLSQFLREFPGGVRLHHQSLVEWLSTLDSGPYHSSAKQAHERLAQACWADFGRAPRARSHYTRDHLPTHLALAGHWDELAKAILDHDAAYLDRWVKQGEGQQGLLCLGRLLDESPLSPPLKAPLATQAARIHSQRGEYAEARQRLDEALRQSQSDVTRKTRAIALHELGSVRLYEGDREAARRHYNEALRLCTRHRPTLRGEAAANRLALATIAFKEYDWRRVLRLARRAREDALVEGDMEHVIAAERLTAIALEDLGRYAEAEAAYSEALAAAREHRVLVEEARLLLLLGSFHYAQAQAQGEPLDAAERWLHEAADLARRIHNLYARLEARMRLGWCALARGDCGGAENEFDGVDEARPASVHDEIRVGVLCGRAVVSHQRGDLERASASYEAVLRESEAGDHRGWGALAAVGLGALAWHASDPYRASALWGRAQALARRTSRRGQRLTDTNIHLCRADPKATPW